MFENIDPNTLAVIGILLTVFGLAVTIILQVIGLAKIIGTVNARLTSHDEQHIRHQTRLDEHASIINQHDRDIAVLTDRQERLNG